MEFVSRNDSTTVVMNVATTKMDCCVFGILLLRRVHGTAQCHFVSAGYHESWDEQFVPSRPSPPIPGVELAGVLTVDHHKCIHFGTCRMHND